MAIVKMNRLRVIALADQRDELLSRLLHVGCVEVTEPEAKLTDPEWTALLNRDIGAQGAMKAKESTINSAMAALNKYAPVKSGLFTVRTDISERDFFDDDRAAKALKVAQTIDNCVNEISQLYTEENRLKSTRESLVPWQTLQEPLDIQSTEHVEIMLGTLQGTAALDEVKGVLAEQAPASELIAISSNKELHYTMLITLKEEHREAVDALKPYGFSVVKFKKMEGSAAENIALTDKKLTEVAQKRETAIETIKSFSNQRPELKLAFDRFNLDAAIEGVKDNALTDGTIVFLEGWAAVPKLDKLKKELQAVDCAYELSEPEKEDKVPTLLADPKWMRGINMVTEMYSLPEYHNGIDPNPLVFFWYVMFFGFMFGDVAYGLIIWLGCRIIAKKYKPKNTLGYMFSLGQWLGASTVIWGFLIGGFFGNVITTISENFMGITEAQYPQWLQAWCDGLLMNPLNDPLKVLIIALCMGFVQLVFGQCIHIYMCMRDGRPLDGWLDEVPWWIFFAGIVVIALNGSSILLIAGVLALICTQGRKNKGLFGKLFGGIASLYNVTGWLSDVLSYARLMALMLATSVIAMVFNTLAALPRNIVVFLIVFLLGHTFNIGVNMVGTYVHAARLQYLEFYGKFYKDGGTPFRPLKYDTKYIDIIEEEN